QTHDEKFAPLPDWKELWDLAAEAAEPILGKSKADLESDCREKFSRKNEDQKIPAPPYSFKKIAAGKEIEAPPLIELQREIPDFLTRLKEFQSSILGVAGLVLIISFLGWFFSSARTGVRSGGPVDSRQLAQKNSQAVGIDGGSRNFPSLISGKTGKVSDFISGQSYASIMSSSEKERNSISDEFRQKSEKAFQEMLLDMNKDENYKGYGEFYLNENCQKGLEMLENGKLTEAKDYLLKALSDSTVSNEAKLLVCQSLMGVAFETGDKNAICKAMETMVSLIPAGDIPKGYDAASLRNSFSQMDRMREIRPDQVQQFMGKLEKQYPGFSPEMQRKFMDGFQNMQKKFQ
ncbi:hypothetical protein HYY75_08590, partial [bacterium]|nr:hypothetical protein [bacterium]